MSRTRAECVAAILALLEPLARGFAELLEEGRRSGSQDEHPLARWPGTARQLRRTLHRLRARGVELDVFDMGHGRYYLRSRDLERLPELLGSCPQRGTDHPYPRSIDGAPVAANDAAEDEDLDVAGARFAEQLLAAQGKRLRAAARAPGGRDEPRRRASSRGPR